MDDRKQTPANNIVVRYRVTEYTRYLLNKHFLDGKWKGKWKTREEWLRIIIDEPLQDFEKK